MTANLEVKEGPREGETFELGKLGSFTIGRRSFNDLPLNDHSVSRKHCRVDYDGEVFWLVDQDSHNGTYVNGRQINKTMLYDGDVIQVGHVEMVFHKPQEEETDLSMDVITSY